MGKQDKNKQDYKNYLLIYGGERNPLLEAVKRYLRHVKKVVSIEEIKIEELCSGNIITGKNKGKNYPYNTLNEKNLVFIPSSNFERYDGKGCIRSNYLMLSLISILSYFKDLNNSFKIIVPDLLFLL